jgi:prephenate dehydratase
MIVSIVILWYYHPFMGKRVAYQGILGSFSSMAARAICGPDCVSIHTQRFREIFEHVVSGRADIGIVPIENALAGSVHESFDLMGEFECSIVAEYYCPVQLHLMALPDAGAELSSFTQALSHPKALEQCSEFFEHHSNLAPTHYSDTAGAALRVRELGDRSIAAIASDEAAATYGLSIIARNIQNHARNSTRFFAVSATEVPCSNPTKASLQLTLPHEPGSLHRLLGEIAAEEINITKIESRPIVGKPFEYAFHLDMECSLERSSSLRDCVARVTRACASQRILGFYIGKRGEA